MQTTMDLKEVIKTRRSIRKWQERDVPTDLILEAIGLATWAPSGGNFQPWRFYVVKNRELINRMADVVQEKQALMASWPEAEAYSETMKRYQAVAPFFRAAPVVIGVAMGAYQSEADKVLRRRRESDPAAAEMIRNRAEISSRTQAIAGATAYLLLALHSLGLGACWMAGPMLARKEIERILGVPSHLELFSLVPVGYPAEDPPALPRRPLEEVVEVLE